VVLVSYWFQITDHEDDVESVQVATKLNDMFIYHKDRKKEEVVGDP
jgi:hypothetical protein